MDQTEIRPLKVRILTPRQTLFEGEAESVSSKNTSGKFDILSGHANFITFVEKTPIEIIKSNKEKLSINISEAIIYTLGNEVTIYAEPHLV